MRIGIRPLRQHLRPACRLALVLLSTACATIPRGTLIGNAAGPLPGQSNISVVEFDDDGFALDPAQSAALLAHIDREVERLKGVNAAQRPDSLGRRTRYSLLVLTFTHGWHNNADTTRGNFPEFRALIDTLDHRLERGYQADLRDAPPNSTVDRVVIVPAYLAWRGRVYQGFIDNITFFGRKRVAERVGGGEFAVLVRALSTRRQRWARDESTESNMLVLTGHSFGGGALLSATLPTMAQHLQSYRRIEDEPAPPADMLIAVNPAIEANVIRRSVLSAIAYDRTNARAMESAVRKAGAGPTLMSASATSAAARDTAIPTRLLVLDADNDRPRHVLFPAGRKLGAFPVLRTLVAMTATYAILANNTTKSARAWRLAAALPLIPGYLSARRSVDWSAGETTVAGYQLNQQGLHADLRSGTVRAGPSCLPVRAANPLIATIAVVAIDTVRHANACDNQVKIMGVSSQIIQGHSGIWGPYNQALITELLLENFRAARAQLAVQKRARTAPSQAK